MAFVIGTIIIRVDNANGIVELQPVLKSQTAARIAFQHPAGCDLDADAGWNFKRLAGIQTEALRRKEVIAGGTEGRPLRQLNLIINLGRFRRR